MGDGEVAVGEVWVFRCVGVDLLCLILRVDGDGFHFLDLEDGTVRKYWSRPALVGFRVGEWHKWEA